MPNDPQTVSSPSPGLNDRSTAPVAVSAIENEIPAYRAVSPQAVFALIFGVLAVLSFASWYFLAFSAAGLLVGYLADRKIQKFPDALTGRTMAQAGMGLGLIFGLSSVTVTLVQGMIRERQARAFATTFESALKSHKFADLVWFTQPANVRDEYDPEKLLAELTKPGPGGALSEERYTSYREVSRALEEPGSEVHFRLIEKHGEEELTQYAAALYEIHRPEAKAPADREQFALAVIKGAKSKKGRLEWWVDSLAYPYTPASFVAPQPVAKSDDGHGHAH